MFATVIGALPRPQDAVDPVRAALAAQEAAGIELLSAGGLGPAFDPAAGPASAVEAWGHAAARTRGSVKQTLPGPYTLARREAPPGDAAGPLRTRVMAHADRLRRTVEALAVAGCPLVEIDEPEAVRLATESDDAGIFSEAHQRLAVGAPVHLSLVLAGGNVDRAGSAAFVEPPYASYAVDLVAGPDNWRLIVDIPGDRGIVCGALHPDAGSDDGPELLVWAAHYAASTGGRGLDRVGLANAPGLERLPWDLADRKLRRLGEAARIAALSRTGALAAALDPRATDLRSRGLGRRPRGRRPER